MQNTQTLKVANPVNDEIVAFSASHASYVDEYYFRKKLQQESSANSRSYPVRVVAIEVGWLFSPVDDHREIGLHFFENLNKSGNIDMFDIESVSIIIEFLYQKYVEMVKKDQFPKYMMYLILYLLQTLINEFKMNQRIYPQIHIHDEVSAVELNLDTHPFNKYISVAPFNPSEHAQGHIDKYRILEYILCPLNIIASIYCFYSTIKKQKGKFSGIQKNWPVFLPFVMDLLYSFFNLISSIMILTDHDFWSLRIQEAFVGLVI